MNKVFYFRARVLHSKAELPAFALTNTTQRLDILGLSNF